MSGANPPAPLPWAVVQVLGLSNPSGTNNVPPAGVTNLNGESLIAVPGLGLKLTSSSSTGSVTEIWTQVTVKAWFDPSVLEQPATWVSNPDDILLNLTSTQLKSTSQPAQLAPGQTVFITLTISL
jgi:hypothetical protein